MLSKKPILLVEDPEADMPVAREALDDLAICNRVVSAARSEAIRYLRGQQSQRPCVVLLSIDDSDADGLAMLRTIKQDEQLKSIPVVVLGPSGDDGLIDESFGLGAAGYMVKSPDSLEFHKTICTLHAYWNLSELPK